MAIGCALAVALAGAGCGSSDGDARTGTAAGESGGGDDGPITMVSWGGRYQAETEAAYARPFTDATGIEVAFASAPGTQVAGLQSQRRAGKQQWDMVDTLPAQDAAFAGAAGLLEPLPADLKRRLEAVLSPGTVNDYGFASGTLGQIIVCNSRRVRACPQNIREFFDVEAFPGKRTIPNQPLEGLTLASIANGTPPSETARSEIDVDAAIETLERIKPEISVVWDSGDQMEQAMLNEEADMGILYSGRTSTLEAGGMDLELVWQDGVYNPGYFVVARDSEHKDAAFRFIESIAENVDGQVSWAEAMDYSVPHPEALEQVSAETAEIMADRHIDVMARQNFDWYADNKEQVDAAWREFVSG